MTVWSRIRWSRIIALIAGLAAATGIYYYFREQTYSVPYLLLIASIECVLIVFLIFLVTAPLTPQRRNLVFVSRPRASVQAIRLPGAGSLAVPDSTFDHRRPTYDVELYVQPLAALLHDYAALASIVYTGTVDRTIERVLRDQWSQVAFALPDKWKGAGLHVEIWENPTKRIVAVVFRGTRFWSLKDWNANLHWLTWAANLVLGGERFESHYTIVGSPEFAAAIDGVVSVPSRQQYALVSVGHSLGGGLAQFFAFVFPRESKRAVSHAFAFNASPVNGRFIGAGFSPTNPTTFVCAFQHGEILAYLRYALANVVPGSATLDYWQLRFNLLKGVRPITHHAMRDFALALQALARLPSTEPIVSRAERIQQFHLIYDYIKFHIALYLATPPVVALFAQDRHSHNAFIAGMVMMISLYIVAGIHAAWFMGTHVNTRWSGDFLDEFEATAYSPMRRFMHHWIYWAGLIAGLSGVVVARLTVQ